MNSTMTMTPLPVATPAPMTPARTPEAKPARLTKQQNTRLHAALSRKGTYTRDMWLCAQDWVRDGYGYKVAAREARAYTAAQA